MRIIVTLDAFGNPMGLATDLKDSFKGLVFEGDIAGFLSSIGYGVTNSISKMASSASHGVGALTFDEQHEERRRQLLAKHDKKSAVGHLMGGVKGLGVGVIGGITALAKNTRKEMRDRGLAKVSAFTR